MQESSIAAERIGRYQILEPIGAGPNGSVWRAKVFGVAGFERQFAIKRFLPEITASGQLAQALSSAARQYGGLEHPRIARMSEFGVAQGQTFTAVELVAGLDALRLVAEARLDGTSLSTGGVLALVSQAARAVGYAHGRGLTHLGLAPTNVMVTADGDVKITDFGILAATMPARPVDVPRLVNRIGYLAPEQLADEATSAATDVFALGTIAYELVLGQRAFKGETPQQIAASIASGAALELPLPRPIVRVLQRCLARSPFERFPDARALADALDAALRVAPVPGTRKDVGMQVKATLDRIAALNEGNMSGVVALNLGTGPIAAGQPAKSTAALAQEAIETLDLSTTEFVRPDVPVAPPTPLVGPRTGDAPAMTMPDLPRQPMTTVPGLAPPPIPVPPGLAPSSLPLPPAPGSPSTMLGVPAAKRPTPPPRGIPSMPPPRPPVPPARANGPSPLPRAQSDYEILLSSDAIEEMEERRLATTIDPPAPMTIEDSGRIETAVGRGDRAREPRDTEDTRDPRDRVTHPGLGVRTGGITPPPLPVARESGRSPVARESGRSPVPAAAQRTASDRPPTELPALAPDTWAPDTFGGFPDETHAATGLRPLPAAAMPVPPAASSAPVAPPAMSAQPPPPIAQPPSDRPLLPLSRLDSEAPEQLEPSPTIGARVVARKPSRLPWLVAGAAVLAVSAVVATIAWSKLSATDGDGGTRQGSANRGSANRGSATVVAAGSARGSAEVAADAGAVVAVAAKPDAGTGAAAAKPDAGTAVAVTTKPDAGAAVAVTTKPDAGAVVASNARPDAGASPATKRDAGAGTTTPTTPTTTPSDALSISSTPRGARVFLDGSDQGATPVKLAGSADRHSLALLLAGHELYRSEVEGHGIVAIALKPVTPPGGPAGIKVIRCKDKDRYYVFVDGKPTGMTCPTERIETSVGPHTVEVYDLQTESTKKWDIVVTDTRLSYRVRIE